MRVSIRNAPGGAGTPQGPDHQERSLMAKERILQGAVPNEVRRLILREAEERYRKEMMDWDERELLWNRILKLRRSLKLA